MIDESTRAALFAEIHRAIEESTAAAVAAFGSSEAPSITYPPGEELSDAEAKALRAIVLSPTAAAAVHKRIAEACAYPMFHLFSLLDNVCEPASYKQDWSGLALIPRTTDAMPMYHDDFYATHPNPKVVDSDFLDSLINPNDRNAS
jgi:hypothetical protein